MKTSTAKRKLEELKDDDDFQTAYFTGKKYAIETMKYLMEKAYPPLPKMVL